VKDVWAILGMALLAIPIAAVFLFGSDEESRYRPSGNDSRPVTYPDEELQREMMPE
jgi:hypothetical protein